VLVLVGLAAACAGTPSEAPSESAGGSGPPISLANDCSDVDLRTPTGQRVDLTGLWQGGDLRHYVGQEGDCVWWVGLSSDPGEPPGAFEILSFQGHIGSDLTLTGEWADVYFVKRFADVSEGRGDVAFKIEITELNGAETIVLTRIGVVPEEERPDQYRAAILTRIDASGQ